MGLISRATKEKPAWLESAREICRSHHITIAAWGPEVLTVEAKSPERAHEIACQLAHLGLRPVEDADNSYAGLLDLSPDPAAIRSTLQSRVASLNVSRRLWQERIEPLIWALCSLLLVPAFDIHRPERHWAYLLLGLFGLAMFFWDGSRVFGWRLELYPEGLRVRRYFRWTTFRWDQIRRIEAVESGHGQEDVIVNLEPRGSESLGRFLFPFARNVRDRLHYELNQHRPARDR